MTGESSDDIRPDGTGVCAGPGEAAIEAAASPLLQRLVAMFLRPLAPEDTDAEPEAKSDPLLR